MSYRVRRFVGTGLALVELGGTVDWHEVEDAARDVYLSPLWVPGSPVLWDMTALTAAVFLPSDLPAARALLVEVAHAREGGRTAILLRPGAEEGVWVLFPRLGPRSMREVRVLYKRADAFAFLGAQPGVGAVSAASSLS